jgi:hypothetical protein
MTDEDPEVVFQLGRLLASEGHTAMAIGMQRHVLRQIPDHAGALGELARGDAAIIDAPAAARCYADALAHEPGIAVHHHDVGSLERFVGMDGVEALLRDAVRFDPTHAHAHAALGNVASRRGDRPAAMSAYAVAALLAWDDADIQLGLAQLYDTAENAADGARHLREALARKTHFTCAARHAMRRVLLIKTPGPYLANALLDFVIDGNRTDVDVFYVTPEATALPDLPDDVVLFNAISEREAHAVTIAHAIALCDAQPKRVINHPRLLHTVRRAGLAARIAHVEGAGAPVSLRIARSDVVTMSFPLLIRPVDTHRGDGLERLDDAHAVASYVQRVPAEHYVLTPFIDYCSADGFYRKYRVIVIAGVPYPYHLGISPDWLVHYWRVADLMRAHRWMRDEEERFLREPQAVFPHWNTAFGEIAAALELDYFGVDCGLLADGTIVVFECDPSAFVHCRDGMEDVLAYKFRYVPRIAAGLDELLSAVQVDNVIRLQKFRSMGHTP